MADFSTNVDIPCLPDDEQLQAFLSSTANGPAAQVNAQAIVPGGCTVINETITFEIGTETFGPYNSGSFPATLGPLTMGGFAGTSFTLTGTLNSFAIVPDQGYEGVIDIIIRYEAEGDTCGNEIVTDTLSLDWNEPQAVIDFPPTDNGMGNYVFDGNNSSAVSCPGSIMTYQWTVYDQTGVNVLSAPGDYTLNSPDLMQPTLDVVLPTGTYVIGLEVTSDCGSGTTTINHNVVLTPTRVIAVDDTDLSAVTVATTGSIDDNNNNIENDPTATYTDMYEAGPCGATTAPLFDIVGLAGSAAVPSNFNGAFSAADQAGITAAITGNIGNPGYTVDKIAIRDIAVAAGVIPDGVEFCITGNVEIGGNASPDVQEEIQSLIVLEAFSFITPGLSGPFTPAENLNLAIGGYQNQDGGFGSLSITDPAELYYSGNAANQWDDVATLQVDNPHNSFQPAIVQNYNEFMYSSVHAEQVGAVGLGLGSFGNNYGYLLDNVNAADPGQMSSIRFQQSHPVQSFFFNQATGQVDQTMNIFLTNAAIPPGIGPDALAGETITLNAIEVQQYPYQSTNQIVVAGSENPNNNTGSPQTATLAGGGTALAQAGGFGLGTGWVQTQSGDVYVRHTGTTDINGLDMTFISSARFKKN